jgi:hypothetical protein
LVASGVGVPPVVAAGGAVVVIPPPLVAGGEGVIAPPLVAGVGVAAHEHSGYLSRPAAQLSHTVPAYCTKQAHVQRGTKPLTASKCGPWIE